MNAKTDQSSLFERMRLEPDEGIYFLSAGSEKRMSTFAQQIRAISLGGSLLQEHESRSEKLRVAVIGAGSAGVTVASMLAWQAENGQEDGDAIEVTVFEEKAEPLTTYEYSNRQIDCRLYEWPLPQWKTGDGDAALPVMTWKPGTGRSVTNHLRKQWEVWKNLLDARQSFYKRITFLASHKVTQIVKKNGSWLVTAKKVTSSKEEKETKTGPETPKEFDIVIVATGLARLANPSNDGKDTAGEPNERWRWDYWSNAEDVKRVLLGHRILVFGRGDSALTRALENGFECNFDNVAPQWQRLDQVRLKKLVVRMSSELGGQEGETNLDIKVGAIELHLHKCLLRIRREQHKEILEAERRVLTPIEN